MSNMNGSASMYPMQPPVGFPGNLTPAQSQVLEEVRRRFAVQATVDAAFGNTMVLLKFCRARDFNLEKVTDLLNRHFQWRTKPLFPNPSAKMGALSAVPVFQLHVSGASASIQARIPQLNKYYPTGYHGTTKTGMPLYIDCVGKIDAGGLFSVATEEEIIEYFISECERRDCIRFPCCSLAAGRLIESSVAVIDLSGLSFRLVTHAMIRKLIKFLSAINQDHYPETLHRMFIVNAPRVFSLAWSFVKPLLDEKTLEKISIYGSDFYPALCEIVDEENIPKFLGGKHGDGVDRGLADIGPWNRPELVRVLQEHHWTEVQSAAFLSRFVQDQQQQQAVEIDRPESRTSLESKLTAASASSTAAGSATALSSSRTVAEVEVQQQQQHSTSAVLAPTQRVVQSPSSAINGSQNPPHTPPPLLPVPTLEDEVLAYSGGGAASVPIGSSQPGSVGPVPLPSYRMGGSGTALVTTNAKSTSTASSSSSSEETSRQKNNDMLSKNLLDAYRAADPAAQQMQQPGLSSVGGPLQQASSSSTPAVPPPPPPPPPDPTRESTSGSSRPTVQTSFESGSVEENDVDHLLQDIIAGESPNGFRSLTYSHVDVAANKAAAAAASSSSASTPVQPHASSSSGPSRSSSSYASPVPAHLQQRNKMEIDTALSPRTSQLQQGYTSDSAAYHSDYGSASDGAWASARGESSDTSSLTPSSERDDILDDWRNANNMRIGRKSGNTPIATSPLYCPPSDLADLNNKYVMPGTIQTGTAASGATISTGGPVLLGRAGDVGTTSKQSLGTSSSGPSRHGSKQRSEGESEPGIERGSTIISGEQNPAPEQVPPAASGHELLLQEFDVLLMELANLESRHMETLRAWGHTQTLLAQEISEHAVERAAKYYDAFFARKDAQDEVSALTHEFQQVSQALDARKNEADRLRKRLQKLDIYDQDLLLRRSGNHSSSYNSYAASGQPQDGTTTAPPLLSTSPGGTYFGPGEEQKQLMLTLQELLDGQQRYVSRGLQIEEQLRTALAELKVNQERFDVLSKDHWYCSWNCSVVRAKKYYHTKHEHEKIVESEMRQIESVHKRLRAVQILRKRAQLTDQQGVAKPWPTVESREGMEKKLFEIESLLGPKRNRNEEEFWSCDDL
ncbi:unnamed protein product [Amoebophrya sp. A120]|nr:unnamed protein product [Amoebophrya sp. A120]|eukprot:GSA120T00003656001.1